MACVAAIAVAAFLFGTKEVELELPVRGVGPEMAARLVAIRAARLEGFAPDLEEQALSEALGKFNAREAKLAAVPPGAVPLKELLMGDTELAALRESSTRTIKSYIANVGAPRYMKFGTLQAERFVSTLNRLVGASARSDRATMVARAGDPAGDFAAICGAFPALFFDRGLIDLDVPMIDAGLRPAYRELAIALFMWRWMLGVGETGPSYLEADERLAYWKALLEVDDPNDPGARLERRLAALREVERFDPTYPSELTRGVLYARAGLLGDAVVELRAAVARTPPHPNANGYLQLVEEALKEAAREGKGTGTGVSSAVPGSALPASATATSAPPAP